MPVPPDGLSPEPVSQIKGTDLPDQPSGTVNVTRMESSAGVSVHPVACGMQTPWAPAPAKGVIT